MEILPLLPGILLSIFLPIILFLVHNRWSPIWLGDKELENIQTVNKYWQKFNIAGMVSGIILGLATFALLQLTNYQNVSTFISPIVSVLTFLAIISVLTDFKLRLVDRQILRVGLAFIVLINSVMLYMYGSWLEIGVYAIVLAIIYAFFFVPGLGASDTRAFLLATAAIFPLFGAWGIAIAGVGMVILALGYNIKQVGFSIKALTSKISLPLVPLILIPTIPTMIAGSFIFL